MKKSMSKKFGKILLVSAMIVPSLATISSPVNTYAYTNSSGQNFTLTKTNRTNAITNELNDYYNHLSSITAVDYSSDLTTELNAIIEKINELKTLLETTKIDEHLTELQSLWSRFAKLNAIISDADLNKMSKNYDAFDNIFYNLYKLSDSIENLDNKASILLTTCREIFYESLKAGVNGYMNGYATSLSNYNDMPEVKYAFLSLIEAASIAKKNIENIFNSGEDGEISSDIKQKIDEMLDSYKDYDLHNMVGVKDDEVDIPETPKPGDGGNITEEQPKDDNDNSFSDIIDNIIKDIIGGNDSIVNKDVNYTSYEYSNGCYKVIKTYDGNGKLVNTKRVKGTSNSDLIYCSISKNSKNKYPETPNLSSYRIKSNAEYEEKTASIVYSLNKTLESPQYYQTTIEIKDGSITYEDTVDLLKQIITKANGYYVEDGNKTMFSIEGKVFVIDDTMTFNKDKFDEISEMFKFVFVGFVSVDDSEEAESTTNGSVFSLIVDKLEVKGTEIKDAKVYVKNEQFMLPVEAVITSIGGKVEMKEKDATATINNTDYFIKNTSQYIYTKDKTFTLLNKNEQSGNKLYADLQSVLELQGLKYSYNQETKTLTIK